MPVPPVRPAAASGAPAPLLAGHRATVLTINVKGFQGSDGGEIDDRSLDAIERYIEQVDPDVVLLQEVDRGTRRAHGRDELAELSRRVGGTDTQFSKALDFDGGEYGDAIVARHGATIRDGADGRNAATVVPLPRSSAPGADHEQRVAVVAPIDLADGGSFTAVNSHVTSRGPGRGAQIEALDEIVRQVQQGGAPAPGAPALPAGLPTTVVLGGDFNARRSAVEEHLGPGVSHVGAQARGLGDTGIDHLYVSSGVRVTDARVDGAETIAGSWRPFGLGDVRSTDHDAVHATLLLP